MRCFTVIGQAGVKFSDRIIITKTSRDLIFITEISAEEENRFRDGRH